MTCAEIREHLLEYQRKQLAESLRVEVDQHLAGCADCRHWAEGERATTDLLERRLPRYSAPLELKRRLEARWAPSAVPRWRWARAIAPLAAAATLVAGGTFFWQRHADRVDANRLVAEAANDHLRVLYSEHPLDIPSGGIHQVKPWFQGRLDFVPVVAFDGDADFMLQGGAVGYFIDRKAAVLVYKRRLHTISLMIVRADGLPWPTHDLQRMGRLKARVERSRGFSVVLWRDGELGYALASDLNAAELLDLGAKIAGP